MPDPWSNRKKVRGWKRQLRKVDRFRAEHLHLDVERLVRGEYEYVKLWVDPWYRLEKRNPPFWYRRLLLGALVDIHDSWRAALLALGEPFYLRIWLWDPNFIRSQVVAAVGGRIEWYRNVFEPDPRLRPSPPPQYRSPAFDLDRFRWEGCKDLAWVTLEDFESPRERAALLRRAESCRPQPDGDTLVTLRHGNVWTGWVPGDGPGSDAES